VAAIAVGGALGTLARYGTDRALVVSSTGFPWATFAVNVTGSFVLGLLVTLVVERWPPTRFVRPFAAIGFCGGFTTFSTLAVEAAQRVQHGHVALAAGYVLASLAAGVVAATLGMALARGRLLPVPRDRPVPDPDDLGTLGPGAGPGGAPT
jgi:CrcB protein